MTPGLVTIGIPVYRRLHFLGQALESCLAQTHDAVEVIISQNPHPNSAIRQSLREWCLEATRRDARVRYRENEYNVGVAENCNLIADDARGEYIMFIGDDDRLRAEGVEHLFASAAGADIVFGNHVLIDANGDELQEKSREYHEKFRRDQLAEGRLSQIDAEHAAWDVSMSPSSTIIRTEIFRSARYQPNLIKEDTEFFIRLASQGATFVFCPQVISEIRHHSDRITESSHGFGDLALALMDRSVSPELEDKRRVAMRILSRQGVGDFMLHGRWEEAKAVMRGKYFPLWTARGFVQFVCLRILPQQIGYKAYRAIYSVARTDRFTSRADHLGEEAMPR